MLKTTIAFLVEVEDENPEQGGKEIQVEDQDKKEPA